MTETGRRVERALNPERDIELQIQTRVSRYGGGPAVKVGPKQLPAPPTLVSPAVAVPFSLGYVGILTFLAAGALAAISIADGAMRSGETWGTPLFWAALGACAIPFAVRLAGPRPQRAERLSLVLVFGFFLYLVKIVRDPSSFTYADELVHAYNVNTIVATHKLFGANPILPVTPHYPGLETLTAALRMLGGTSTFTAGVIVIGLARLLMMLVLYLLFENISGSARVAGLAALLYTAAPNFVFFDGAFSYEPLALPLALLASYAVFRWMALKESDRTASPPQGSRPRRFQLRHGWGAVAVISTLAVIVTHHVSSYLLVLLILGVGRAQRDIRRSSKYVSPFPFAAFALVGVLLWLVYSARSTWSYLSPVFTSAIKDAIDTATGTGQARTLFAVQQDPTPTWGRALAIGAAVIVTLGLPFGLRRIWKDHRTNPITVVLGLVGVAYVGSLVLRLVPAAWEIANRASEFLFIGVGLALALAYVAWELRGPSRFRWPARIAVGVAFAIMLEGGMIAGWNSDIILAQTLNVSASNGATIRPQGYAVADWAKSVLGPHRNFAADASDARLLDTYADENAIAGGKPDVQAVIRDPLLEDWHIRLLGQYKIPYLVVNNRVISEDAISGYFFLTATSPPSWHQLFGKRSVEKFDRLPAASRLFDSGNIVVYDVSGVIAQDAP